MKRYLYAFLAVIVLAAIPTVAFAAPVIEPSAPISDLRIHVFRYDILQDVDCSGQSPPVPFSVVRIEPSIVFAGAPSEHWDTILRVFRNGNALWGTNWLHQNVMPVPPNPPGGRFKIVFADHYFQGSTGRFKIDVTVHGLASGAVLHAVCVFDRTNP